MFGRGSKSTSTVINPPIPVGTYVKMSWDGCHVGMIVHATRPNKPVSGSWNYEVRFDQNTSWSGPEIVDDVTYFVPVLCLGWPENVILAGVND